MTVGAHDLLTSVGEVDPCTPTVDPRLRVEVEEGLACDVLVAEFIRIAEVDALASLTSIETARDTVITAAHVWWSTRMRQARLAAEQEQ